MKRKNLVLLISLLVAIGSTVYFLIIHKSTISFDSNIEISYRGLEEEEIEVIEAFINNSYPVSTYKNSIIYISQNSIGGTNGPSLDNIKKIRIGACKEQEEYEIILDTLSKSIKCYDWSRINFRNINIKYDFMSKAEEESKFLSPVKSAYENYIKRTPHLIGLIRISRIAFNKNMTLAYFYAEGRQGANRGANGGEYYYKKVNGKWVFSHVAAWWLD